MRILNSIFDFLRFLGPRDLDFWIPLVPLSVSTKFRADPTRFDLFYGNFSVHAMYARTHAFYACMRSMHACMQRRHACMLRQLRQLQTGGRCPPDPPPGGPRSPGPPGSSSGSSQVEMAPSHESRSPRLLAGDRCHGRDWNWNCPRPVHDHHLNQGNKGGGSLVACLREAACMLDIASVCTGCTAAPEK